MSIAICIPRMTGMHKSQLKCTRLSETVPDCIFDTKSNEDGEKLQVRNLRQSDEVLRYISRGEIKVPQITTSLQSLRNALRNGISSIAMAAKCMEWQQKDAQVYFITHRPSLISFKLKIIIRA